MMFFGLLLLVGTAFAPAAPVENEATEIFDYISMYVLDSNGDNIVTDGTYYVKLYSINHEVSASLAESSMGGWAVGAPRFGVLTVTKAVDGTSPRFYEMLVGGETLQSIDVLFPHLNSEGNRETFYTMAFYNVNVVSIKSHFPLTFLSENSEYKYLEDVSFTYESMRWTHDEGGMFYTSVQNVLV